MTGRVQDYKIQHWKWTKAKTPYLWHRCDGKEGRGGYFVRENGCAACGAETPQAILDAALLCRVSFILVEDHE
jgi:hypothetical protein